MSINIEEIKKEIKNKIDQAQESYDENAAISINAYGTGYEKGAFDALTEILEFIEEIA